MLFTKLKYLKNVIIIVCIILINIHCLLKQNVLYKLIEFTLFYIRSFSVKWNNYVCTQNELRTIHSDIYE